MSSIQEMIEMQNRIAKMVEPIAGIWNNPAINYLQQNATEINRVSQCALTNSDIIRTNSRKICFE